MNTQKKETAKERILRKATELFYKEGIRAVGIDRIIAESGVAKASFYRNFATKDDLVVAYLERYYRLFMIPFEESEQRDPGAPLNQLYDVMERLSSRIEQPGFRGCPFLNTAVEFPDENHPSHEPIMIYHREMKRHMQEMAERAGAKDPETLSAQLMLLFNGALMSAYLERTSYIPGNFLSSAKLLIKQQI
ncbi:TetR family transcriptional regulator [Paenibacillus alvei TS-15]|uniref:TetR family transcriptional regulator n=1 Tax=Paenibacillus alvei TS-15 TaxID=1117108 RepID=S9ST36_PAEAL|nr:TetR/AcrR family transcriptional regulator [Paenibacillus alvei]EPY07308.1 TetR family transcriptional regulator [Paenibacillus alvei TS-15]